MISAEQFVAILEQKDLLPPQVVVNLRQQLARAKQPIDAAAVAKLLIDKGYLTMTLALRLLEGPGEKAAPARPPTGTPPPKSPLPKPPPPKTPPPQPAPEEVEEIGLAPEGDELTLAPLEDEPLPPQPVARVVKEPLAPLEELPSAELEELAPLEDLELAPLADAPKAAPTTRKPAAPAAVPLSPAGKPRPAAPAVPAKAAPASPVKAAPAGRKPTTAQPAKPAASAPAGKAAVPARAAPAKSAIPSPPAPAAAPAAKPLPPVVPALDLPVTEPEPMPSLLDEVLTPEDESELSPLDGLSADASLTAGKALGAAKKEKKKKRGSPSQRDRWDSALMMVGGGALLLIVILLGVFYWLFTREGGDKMLQQADEDYKRGSYAQAIHEYALYLEQYPSHPGAGVARVRRGLAEMRQATERSTNWSKSLSEVKRVLGEIVSAKEFDAEAPPELAALLSHVAEGLANEANANLGKQDAAALKLKQARESLALIEDRVPKAQRPTTKLADLAERIDYIEQQLHRDVDRDKAVAEMAKAVSAGQTARAYEIRDKFLKRYPLGKTEDPKLKAAVLAVSQKEREAVKLVEDPRAPQTDEPADPAAATLALASRTGEGSVAGAEGRTVAVLAKGAAYGLDAAGGRVLWRRALGFDNNGRGPGFPPTPVSDAPGSDLLLADPSTRSVIRVEAATGKLRWRQAIGPADQPFDDHPVLAGDRLLVATREGRIVRVDLQTGESPGYIALPQELRVAPVYDAQRSAIYQVAEHSNLYVISPERGKAGQVFYLGHQPGSVLTPPALIDRFLVVGENHKANAARLRVLEISTKDGQPRVREIQEVALEGRLAAAPLVTNRRVVAVTSRGNVYAYEISGAKPEEPLVFVGMGNNGVEEKESPDAAVGLVRFLLMSGSEVYVADTQLTRFELHASQVRLQPLGIDNDECVTLQPLASIGSAIYHVRCRTDLPGVRVSAMKPEGGEPFWETQLAAPVAAEPQVGPSGRITAVTEGGAVFHLEKATLRGRAVIDQPAARIPAADLHGKVAWAVPAEGGLLLGTAGEAKRLYFAPGGAAGPLLRLPLPDRPVGRGAPLAGGVLVPTAAGQVLLLDPSNGMERAAPFQPILDAGVMPAWLPPALAGQDAVLSDGRRKLYRVNVNAKPAPHLDLLASTETAQPVLAIVGQGTSVYTVDAARRLTVYDLPDLKRGEEFSLSGRCLWGPYALGARVLLATDDDQLYCLADKKVDWQIGLTHGPLVGRPAEWNGTLLLASSGGTLLGLKPDSGAVVQEIPAGRPLAAGPVPIGEEILVAGQDGTLSLVKKP